MEGPNERRARGPDQPERMGTDEHTGEQLANDRRLAEALEQLARHLGGQEDHEQVDEDRGELGHGSVARTPGPRP